MQPATLSNTMSRAVPASILSHFEWSGGFDARGAACVCRTFSTEILYFNAAERSAFRLADSRFRAGDVRGGKRHLVAIGGEESIDGKS